MWYVENVGTLCASALPAVIVLMQGAPARRALRRELRRSNRALLTSYNRYSAAFSWMLGWEVR